MDFYSRPLSNPSGSSSFLWRIPAGPSLHNLTASLCTKCLSSSSVKELFQQKHLLGTELSSVTPAIYSLFLNSHTLTRTHNRTVHHQPWHIHSNSHTWNANLSLTSLPPPPHSQSLPLVVVKLCPSIITCPFVFGCSTISCGGCCCCTDWPFPTIVAVPFPPPFSPANEFDEGSSCELILPLLQILLYKSGVAVAWSSISVLISVNLSKFGSDGKYVNIR